MTFSKNEKKAASGSTYKIKNFINQMSHSQIQQDTRTSTQTLEIHTLDHNAVAQLIQNLKKCIDEMQVSAGEKSELEADIATVEAQLKSPKPKSAVLRESLHSIRCILEGAAGSGLASGIIYEIVRLLR